MPQFPEATPSRPSGRRETPSPRQHDAAAIALGVLLMLAVGLRDAAGPPEVAHRATEPEQLFGSLLFGPGLDPASAPASAWEALPGIGPARAAAITAARRDRPFCELRDLERVPGLGARTVARLGPWLRPPPWAARCEPGPD